MCVSWCCSVQYVSSTVRAMYVHPVILIRRLGIQGRRRSIETTDQHQIPSTLSVAFVDCRFLIEFTGDLRYSALHARTTARQQLNHEINQGQILFHISHFRL